METAPESVADPVHNIDAADGNAVEDSQKDAEKHSVQEPRVPGETEKQGITVDAKTEGSHEELLPPEVDSIEIPLYWHAKPCVHVTSIGGPIAEEELWPLFSKYGQISSISFENERHDAAVIRYENYSGNAEELLARVRQALNSTKLGDMTLIVEPFRPDSLLFIGNLTLDIDDSLLQKMFEPHGKIERAFVLRNAEGRSKGYGFVEYSLKSQATTAKMTMGNINMDGRVLRVEWSDCRKVADMFSSVLFIDRLPRECFHIDQSLKGLFGKYGKIRDCHVAIGINQQYRGFAFMDFAHSSSADRAHQALDGHILEGSNIRVSFANPSKSAQSYKFRYGSEAAQAALGMIGKGGPAGKGPSPMPLMPPRFMSPARPGMVGMGIGMQFGRGSLDRGMGPPLHSSGAGMIGPGSGMVGRAPLLLGNVAPRVGMSAGGNFLQKLPLGQGAITPTNVQVFTGQAKAHEEEAKARAETVNIKQGGVKSVSGDLQSMDQYQRFQQVPQQNYYQQQQTIGSAQQYKQSDSVYSYPQSYQQQSSPQQASLQTQYQAWNQQPGQQAQQSYGTQYYSHPNQTYTMQQNQHQEQPQQQQQQQEHNMQYSHQYGYYQPSTAPAQYVQNQGFHYAQQTVQSDGQTTQTGVQPQSSYVQQSYNEQYAQPQQAQQPSQSGVAVTTATVGVTPVEDASQQNAYSTYYQQQAQAQVYAQAGAGQVGSATAASSTPSTTQQSYEAQWAAYYASQAAYQQANYAQQQSYGGSTIAATSYQEQTSTGDVGQKRAADQMESTPLNQASYNYPQTPGYGQQGMLGYQQQQQQLSASATAAYQQQPANATGAYQQQQQQLQLQLQLQLQPQPQPQPQQQQQGTSAIPGYQQPGASGAVASYLPSGYEQPMSSVPDSYQQQAVATPGTYQVGMQGQPAVSGGYDYSKRPRY